MPNLVIEILYYCYVLFDIIHDYDITEGDKDCGSGYCFTQGKAKTYTDNLNSKKSISHRYSCEKNYIQNISKKLFNYLINNILLSF